MHAGPGEGMHAVHAGSSRAQHGAPVVEALQARPAVHSGQQRLCLLPVLLPGVAAQLHVSCALHAL